MLRRVKQVFAAWTAKVETQDRDFLMQWLNKPEQKLFWAMNLPDQRHALNVSYTALRLAEERHLAVNEEKLIKCCLLHDVGKVRGDVSTLDKVFAVIVFRCAPDWALRQCKAGKGGLLQNLRHALYIYAHHGARGYDKLLSIGETELAKLVRSHHEAARAEDAPELLLLREADELN